MRWVLIEAQSTLLPGIEPTLARYTERLVEQTRHRGLPREPPACRASTRVVTLDRDDVEPYRSETIVWTAGQRPSPFVADLGLPLDGRGRVVVDEYLAAPGVAGTYVVGDAAAVPDPDGGTCPATAQHALRQGHVAAINAAADLGDRHARAVSLSQPWSGGDPGPLAGCGTGERVQLHRATCVVDGTQLSPTHDPRPEPQGRVRDRLDVVARVPARCRAARVVPATAAARLAMDARTRALAELTAPGAPFAVVDEDVLGVRLPVFAQRHAQPARDVAVVDRAIGDAGYFTLGDRRSRSRTTCAIGFGRGGVA